MATAAEVQIVFADDDGPKFPQPTQSALPKWSMQRSKPFHLFLRNLEFSCIATYINTSAPREASEDG